MPQTFAGASLRAPTRRYPSIPPGEVGKTVQYRRKVYLETCTPEFAGFTAAVFLGLFWIRALPVRTWCPLWIVSPRFRLNPFFLRCHNHGRYPKTLMLRNPKNAFIGASFRINVEAKSAQKPFKAARMHTHTYYTYVRVCVLSHPCKNVHRQV